MEDKYLEEADKKYVWHPFTQMKGWLREEPVIIEEGRDCYIRDIHGRWYLDGVSSLWVNIHGHRKKKIDDAIKRQLDKIAHSTMLGLSSVPAIQLAEKLIGVIQRSAIGDQQSAVNSTFNLQPSSLTKVFYSDNGSTAVEVALKMAFQYWRHKGVEGKNSFLSLDNAYHGDTLGAVSVGGIDIFHSAFGPLLFKTFRAPAPYCYRCEFGCEYPPPHNPLPPGEGGITKPSLLTGKGETFSEVKNPSPLTGEGKGWGEPLPDCRRLCLGKMEEILSSHSREIAAVIIEPLVQAAGGMIVSPEGYLKGVRDLCAKYNVLLIADEVATGFGRTGKMFACGHESVTPDIICLSKGITGGYMPLAVTVSTDEVYNAFLGEFNELKTFFHGHSYTGNPLGCAAALACLEIFEEEDTLGNLQPKIRTLQGLLREISALPHVGDARNKGLMAGLELVRDKGTKEPYAWDERMGWKVASYAREKGVFIRPLGNVIVIMPPLSISHEDLTMMLYVIRDGIRAVT